MKLPQKRYIVWIGDAEQGYFPKEYETVEEALLIEKPTLDWYLTEAVNGISAYTKFDKPKIVLVEADRPD